MRNTIQKSVTIDFGNSRIKIAIFEQGAFKEMLVVESLAYLPDIVNNHHPQSVICASVGSHEKLLVLNQLSATKVLLLDHTTPVPVKNLYATPETLGMDRLAAAVGASTVFSGDNCLIIDAGSCITYDFIDSLRNFHGGSISPGIDIRMKALHAFTASLPLLTASELMQNNILLTGRNTAESMASGVINGAIYEVNGFIESYMYKHKNLKVVICGGDSSFFESSTKHPIFAIPELIHLGLNRILEYNESL